MKFLHPLPWSLVLFCASACQAPSDSPDASFRYQSNGDGTADLMADGDFLWWTNTHPAAEYQGWSTDYAHEGWAPAENQVSLRLIEDDGVAAWPTAEISFGDDITFQFTHLEYGFGWVGLHQDPEASATIDLVGLDLSPSDENKFSRCQLDQARVLLSLSKYSASPEQLMATAKESARIQELPEPNSWHDVVKDPVMYDMLFYEKGSQTVQGTTFAYLAINLDPLCEDTRVALRSEEQLAGFVDFSPSE